MRIAALDLGSNTFILLIVEVADGEIKNTLVDETRVVRLGQNLFETGEFHHEALDRAEKCFFEFKKIIERHNVDKIVSVATSASRDAKNKDLFFNLGSKHGIPIKVISGELEAKLTFMGAVSPNDQGQKVVIDVGGGSTEVVGLAESGKILKHSFNLGCVRLNEKFLSTHPTLESEMKSLRTFIKSKLDEKKELLREFFGFGIVAVAGTPTTVADILLGGGFDRAKIENSFITLQKWNELLDRFCKMSINERLKIPGMRSGREDVIISGMLILSLLAEEIKAKGFSVSTKGVRYGLALEASSNPDF